MGSAASLTGCICGTACQCICSAFQMCGATPRVFSRIGYVLFAFVWILVSVLFLFYGHYIFELPFSSHIGCTDQDMQTCIGISAVYRTSITLVVFHLLLGLLCTCKGELINSINEGAWPLKFIVVIALFFLSFIFTNSFFIGYGYFAMVGSFIFIIFEAILLIDMAYSWNEAWVGNYNESNGSGCSTTMLIIFTAGFTGGAIAIYIWMFVKYASTVADVFIIGMPIVAAVGYYIISVLGIVEGSSLFTCSLLFFFESFLTLSIMWADPEKSGPGYLVLQIVIGLAFLFFVLIYAGIRTQAEANASEDDKKKDAQKTTSKAADLVAEKSDGPAEPAQVLTSHDTEEAPAMPVTEKTAYFHLLMAFASLYYSMVLTNWGSPNLNGNWPKGFSNPWLGYGAMLAAQWIGILIFFWTLIAPKLCPNREFS